LIIQHDRLKQKTIGQLLIKLEIEFNQYKQENLLTEKDYPEFIKTYEKEINKILINEENIYGIDLKTCPKSFHLTSNSLTNAN
jgi:hypothetical protein